LHKFFDISRLFLQFQEKRTAFSNCTLRALSSQKKERIIIMIHLAEDSYENTSTEAIRQLDEQYRSYISRFSHEIRNPLTLINSSLQLLEKECPAVRKSILWPQIHQDIQDVIALLQKMTSFCKSGTLTIQPVPVLDFLSSTADACLPLMETHHILCSTCFDATLNDALIQGDAQKLREVILNLIVNAIDALDASAAAHRKIQISAACSDSSVILHIMDNGPGIPAEYLSTLFEPFVTHKSQGTGLGLSIARNIVQLHGGSITVDTCTESSRSYTDFCVSLPLAS
jgi:two-component system, sporulation sensor kinase D